MVEQSAIARGRGVVELIDDDIGKFVRWPLPQFARVVALDGTEQVATLARCPHR